MHIESFPADHARPVSALAFDYGAQRIGVAFGQSLSGTARPVSVLKARDGVPDWEQIRSLIETWQPDIFIVGLPYNLDGSDSELLPRAIKFANRINGRFHKPCYGMDERLSSRAAIEKIAEQNGGGRSSGGKKRAAIDDIAAQIILENWFAEFNLRIQTSAID